MCALGCNAVAQQQTIIWNERQPLKWVDFAGSVIDTSEYDAESFAEVKYTYTFNSPKDFYFEVFANFNKNTSWCRKELQCGDLLKHEQLHFDIAEIYARKLRDAFYHFQYSNNFEKEIEQIFDEKKAAYHLMQRRYDDETNHSLRKDRQKEWETFIDEQLNKRELK